MKLETSTMNVCNLVAGENEMWNKIIHPQRNSSQWDFYNYFANN